MAGDLRVRMTKKLIQDKFFEILKDTPLNKVTVKSICDSAEINRTTFYKYYNDPYDLMEKIEDELIINMQEFYANSDDIDIKETMLVILNNIKANEDIYKTIIIRNNDLNFINKMIMNTFKMKSESLEYLAPNISDIEKEWLFRFMTYGFTNIIVSWIEKDMEEPTKEVADFINNLNNVILKGIL